jgi:exopolysaccharide biosynthesis polyprenyl glycosylphosphotransferase
VTPHADLRVVPDVDTDVAPHAPSRVVPVLVGLVAALAVSVVADRLAASCACAVAWGLVAAVQSALHRRAVAVRVAVRDDVRTGVVLVSLLSIAGVADLVAVRDARWGIAVVAAAVAAAVSARLLQPRRTPTRRVVLVGEQHDIDAYSTTARGADVEVAGCHVVDAAPGPAGLERLGDLVEAVRADMVLVLPGRKTDADTVRRLTWALEHHRVLVAVVTPVSSVGSHRLRTSELGRHAILEVGAAGVSVLEARAKAVIDRIGALVLLVVVAPLLLFMVAAVRLDSRGPGLFVQTRVGMGGQLFRMFKMRTMFTDAESMKQALMEDNESDGVLFKIRRDPRVTRFGYWLRRSSLDELPQLLNVLRGEMSLVGPRPALPSEVASYDEDARRRLVVKPGITGLWQVSGRSDLQWDESLRLDLYYADNWRLVDDLVIAARTVTAVTLARGAY